MDKYIPSGELQGDDKAMADKGTGTGWNGDTYGADVSPDACNCMGKITGSTKSDKWDQDMPHKSQTI